MSDEEDVYASSDPRYVVVETAPGGSRLEPDEAEAFANQILEVAGYVREQQDQ